MAVALEIGEGRLSHFVSLLPTTLLPWLTEREQQGTSLRWEW